MYLKSPEREAHENEEKSEGINQYTLPAQIICAIFFSFSLKRDVRIYTQQ